MPTQDNKKESTDTQQETKVKKPLPSGTVTTIRSSIFELGSTDKTKNR